MSSNFMKLKQPIQMAATNSMKVPSMMSTSMTSNFAKTGASSKVMSFRETLYERAIGQHLHKSASAHPDPCRFGDFEVKGRVSDF
ncbi:hypothetical protein PVAND_005971 [Polypedilum vanderplanki]|uniref:Uncharacterized protein n=1 Tax=Polypedilum vanderplanki TaxID=319348 RepID=A0A9J6C3K9_POLVA|nr:hypothetical protein PVAND_005971 [Polypedilum vanderplanki]